MAKQKKDTPAAGMHARREGENDLKNKTSLRAQTKTARREGENDLEKTQPACEPKKPRLPQGKKRFSKKHTGE